MGEQNINNMIKEKKLELMGETMKQIWDLNNKGLLSTIDVTVLIDRVKHKYKLSPLKYFPSFKK